MPDTGQRDEALVRYLLDDLSEPERARIEQRLFSGDRVVEELQALEDDLVDEYVRGSLADRDRQLFDARLAHSARLRARVQWSHALAPTVDRARAESPTPAARTWSTRSRRRGPARAWLAIAASVVALAAVAAWLARENVRLGRELERARTAAAPSPAAAPRVPVSPDPARPEPPQADRRTAQARHEELERLLKPVESTRPLVSVVLTPGLEREASAGARLVRPTAGAGIELRLQLPGASGSAAYRAAVRTAEGEEIWSQGRLRPVRTPEGGMLICVLPPGLLTPGDFVVTVSLRTPTDSFQDVEDFAFRVPR